MKTAYLILTISASLIMALPAEDAAPAGGSAKPLTPEETAVAAKANALIEAFNKGDAAGIASQFAPDAEWIDDDGQVMSGKDAIQKNMTKMLAEHKGRKLDLDVESVRPITPDVVVEKGTSTVEEPDGTTTVSSYTATRVKKDGDWLITQLTETGAPLAGNAEHHLQELAWLIGTWDDNSPDAEVHVVAKWTAQHAFITRTFASKLGGDASFEGTEVIGWDPVAGKIRSWVFDSDGGFSENFWNHEGHRWLIRCSATLADGRQSSADHTLTFINKDKHTWSSSNRQVDGELMPNIDPIEIVRSK